LNIDAPDDVAEQLEEIARAVARRGIEVRRVGGPEDLNGLTDRAAYWYGGPLVSSRLTSRLAIGLLEPEDAWLPSLGRRYTGRRIEAATLEAAWALTRPAFVKPPSDKSFPAQVYLDGSHLPSRGAGLAPETPALISDVMSLACEYRLFLLDGAVAAASRYAVFGRLDVAPLEGDPREREVRAFAATLTRRLRYSLPSAVVVDIGLAADPDTGRERWVVVEANMAWTGCSTWCCARPGRSRTSPKRTSGTCAHAPDGKCSWDLAIRGHIRAIAMTCTPPTLPVLAAAVAMLEA
jgi:hypothetical protein